MKHLLLLGGSAQQVVAIKTAKKMGIYTILCDYLPDNPGQFYADKYYLESTTNKEKILNIARDEAIDGIVAYASDPAAPTAAYVAEKLKLPTNSYESVCILCNKDKFREFLKFNGFNTPLSKTYTDSSVIDKECELDFPVIVKPVDSSGSKGVSIVSDTENLKNAIEFSLSYSRTGKCIVEQYIQNKYKYIIGGDVFVVDGKIEIWGLLNCHRDKEVNSLVPVGKSFPLCISHDDEVRVKRCLQSLVDKLNIMQGAMNVELIVDKCNRVWPIDIGPRNGGNMIPNLLGYIYGIDVVKMTLEVAMGQTVNYHLGDGNLYYATHNLHSKRNGKLDDIIFSDVLKDKIIQKCIYKKKGDEVEYFDNASKALGIIFMKFSTNEEMMQILDNINDYITIKLF